MATKYKHQYETMKMMVAKYQDEIVPELRKIIEDLEHNRVEVVRCKDCKHWCYEYDCVGLCTTDVPDIDGVQREDFDFCSYGERKDDA